MLQLEKKQQQDLDTILNQEELFWFQKSREEWIASGERNTKFYHVSSLVRKSRDRITTLRNSTGEWITEPSILENMVSDYYHNLFSSKGNEQPMQNIMGEFPALLETQTPTLLKPFSKEEVKNAIFGMAPFKPPGTDGMHSGFYQNLWEVVGDSVCSFVLRFLETGSLHHGVVNDTIVALVPKPHPISPYLFVLYMESLGHIIHSEVNIGNWKPIQLSRNGPDLSLLMILFFLRKHQLNKSELLKNY